MCLNRAMNAYRNRKQSQDNQPKEKKMDAQKVIKGIVADELIELEKAELAEFDAENYEELEEARTRIMDASFYGGGIEQRMDALEELGVCVDTFRSIVKARQKIVSRWEKIMDKYKIVD